MRCGEDARVGVIGDGANEVAEDAAIHDPKRMRVVIERLATTATAIMQIELASQRDRQRLSRWCVGQ